MNIWVDCDQFPLELSLWQAFQNWSKKKEKKMSWRSLTKMYHRLKNKNTIMLPDGSYWRKISGLDTRCLKTLVVKAKLPLSYRLTKTGNAKNCHKICHILEIFLVFSSYIWLTNKRRVKIKDMVVSQIEFWEKYIFWFLFKKKFMPLLGFVNIWIPFVSFSWECHILYTIHTLVYTIHSLLTLNTFDHALSSLVCYSYNRRIQVVWRWRRKFPKI